MGGETLAAENEVELEVLVVRSSPSCLMLSSTGWAAVTSFQSCWRSEGHTAEGGEQEKTGPSAEGGGRGRQHPRAGLAQDPIRPPPAPLRSPHHPQPPNFWGRGSTKARTAPRHRSRPCCCSLPSPLFGGKAAAVGASPGAPQPRALPWGRVCRGTVPWPGGRLTSPWRCRFNRCCCWSCCICRSCCWNASCLFPNGCWETKGRKRKTPLAPAWQGGAAGEQGARLHGLPVPAVRAAAPRLHRPARAQARGRGRQRL